MKKYKNVIIIVACLCIAYAMLPFNVRAAGDSELISLDLKGMDIHDVLKILSQKSGFNIVADTDVKGTVTLYIKDVSVMQALDIIAATHNLAYEQQGTLIRIMNDKDYERVHGRKFDDKTKTEIVKLTYAHAGDIDKALNQLKSNIGKVISDDTSRTIVMIDTPEHIKKMKEVIVEMDTPLVTEVFNLDYAKAEVIKDKIGEMISKDAGGIRFDEKTNKLVVKDTPQKMEDIRRVIKAFDEKTRQVLIDASIVQVTLSDKYSFGIDWQDIAAWGGVKLTEDTNISTGLSNVTPSTISIATTGGNYTTVISLLKTYGEANVLSRPRITVIDGQEAKILVGSKEAYVTSEVTTASGGTYHTTDHVEFVDVGVRLGVTPEINSQGFITLKIKPEVSSADATKTVQLKNPDGSTRTIVPYVTISEAETSVVVKDGTTIIIGGLMKDTTVNNKEKVPFFGDIPIIGKLFSTTGKTKEKTELVIFLTPHIIEGDMTTEEAKKYVTEQDKKIEKPKIEKPEAPPQIKPVPTARKPVAKKPVARSKPAALQTKPASKWAPLFEGKSEHVKEPKAYRQQGVAAGTKTPYEEYYLKIREDINTVARQQEDVGGIKGEVELQFTLDNEGFLVKSPIVLNKPDLKLVRSSVNAVKKAAPFGRFPKGLNKNEAEFNIIVRYE